MVDRASLPPAVQDALTRPEVDRLALIRVLGSTLHELKDDAVKARQESGIEEVWLAAEEAYLGIDDANRGQFANARWAKPTSMAGPLTTKKNRAGGLRSTAFIRLTSRFVDAGDAKIGEISEPVDDMPFKLDPTPVPDLIDGQDDERPVMENGQPVMRPVRDDEQAPAVPDGQPQGEVPLTVKDLARFETEKAEAAAKKAGKRIYDWMVQGRHSTEMRKLRFDMSRLGTGVIKGPVPHRRKGKAITRGPGGEIVIARVDKVAPVTKWVDPWNFFPARDCGEDIHSGGSVWERDYLSAKALRALKEQPNYIAEEIDRVLAEGPGKIYLTANANPGLRAGDLHRSRFEVYYGYAEVSRRDLALANTQAANEVPEDQETAFVIVTMVNDSVIKMVLNPLDSGNFPYRVGRWRRRAGHWTGVGIAEQVSTPQAVVNGATRAMMNNGGQSAGVTRVVNRSMLEPADGEWDNAPDKTYWTKPGPDGQPMEDARKAMTFLVTPNVTQQMLAIEEFGEKVAEYSTNIPLISQGQSGKTTPDTFGGQQLQDNNANQLLRAVGHGLADDVIDPLVQDFYEWLLLDPDVPADEKGDFQVNTNAFAAQIERAIQDQAIVQMGPLVPNPVFGVDPKRWFATLARTKRLNPKDFQYTEEEQAQMEKNQQPPIPIAVAQVRAQSAEKIAESRDNLLAIKTKADTDRDTVYAEAERARASDNARAREADLIIKRETAQFDYHAKLLDYANRRQISLERAQTELARTAMELNVQRELAGADGKGPQVADAPVEPAGRAPDGEAFQK